jgi:hypothetical protein
VEQSTHKSPFNATVELPRNGLVHMIWAVVQVTSDTMQNGKKWDFLPFAGIATNDRCWLERDEASSAGRATEHAKACRSRNLELFAAPPPKDG